MGNAKLSTANTDLGMTETNVTAAYNIYLIHQK